MMAYGVVQYFAQAQQPTDLPIYFAVELDRRALVFAVAISMLSTILFGLTPAMRSTRFDLVPSLKASDKDGSKEGLRGRSVLVVVQVALSMVMLMVSALLFAGFKQAFHVGPRFRTTNLAMMSFSPALAHYTPEQTRDFYKTLVTQTAGLAGVEHAALSYVVPMSPSQHGESFLPEGYGSGRGQGAIWTMGNIVGPDYFQAMGIPLVRGRVFADTDRESEKKVAIINEVIANKYFKGKDAVGQRIHLGDETAPWAEIVGVAKTTKVTWLGEAPEEFLYLPYEQHPKVDMTMLVQTRGDAAQALTSLRQVVDRIDPNQPVFDVQTMEHYYAKRAILVVDMLLTSVATLGLMGLFLAMVGLYGLVSYSIAQRKREIALRMAIGAEQETVLRMVLRQGLVLGMIGLMLGVIGSVAVRPVLEGFASFGKAGWNWGLLVPVGAGLLVVTLLATWAPARRAARLDPMTVLRED
jgi:predicted permease